MGDNICAVVNIPVLLVSHNIYCWFLGTAELAVLLLRWTSENEYYLYENDIGKKEQLLKEVKCTGTEKWEIK